MREAPVTIKELRAHYRAELRQAEKHKQGKPKQ